MGAGIGAAAIGGAAGAGFANPAAGGLQGPGGRPHPMGKLIHALKSGNPQEMAAAQQFLKQHPEVAQRIAARLNDPAMAQKLADRITQHGGNGADIVAKLKQLVGAAAGGAPAAAPTLGTQAPAAIPGQ